MTGGVILDEGELSWQIINMMWYDDDRIVRIWELRE